MEFFIKGALESLLHIPCHLNPVVIFIITYITKHYNLVFA